MDNMAHRVALSYTSKISKANIETGDMGKLLGMQEEIGELKENLKDLEKYHKLNSRTDSTNDRIESEKEIAEVRDRIKSLSDEYAKIVHRIYPNTPLKDCYPLEK